MPLHTRVVCIALAALACGGSTPPPASTPSAHADKHDGHAKGNDGHAEGDHATVRHRFDDVERWVKAFDDPARDAWQRPADVVAALALEPGHVVADIGAGTGYFNPHLAAAVGPEGTVVAADVEPNLVAHMEARAKTDGNPQVKPRQIPYDDPGLKPAEVDRVLLVDTYHHIDARVAWFGKLTAAMKPGGKLVIVDFKPGDLPVGPPPSHRIPVEKVRAELAEAGWTRAGGVDSLPYQFVEVFEVAD
jgi:ubiquinone/menaquinone biosynthesis C-methylase UbiE